MYRRSVKLEELLVEIAGVEIVDHLLVLFTSCRNIKKFALRSWRMDVADWSRCLRTILPIFSELEKLTIDKRNYDNEDINELFDVIFSNCPNLRKLGVRRKYKRDAENYFRSSNLIIFKC
jgi:hypothetical protein